MPSPTEAEASGAAASPTLRDGRYVVVGSLGRGSQAETLDAVDKREGRAVAIKRFAVQHARSWKEVELAQREASVLATLEHPHLPHYIEHFEEDGALYLVMEKIEGRSLARRDLGLDQTQVLRFLSDAGTCLNYLHGRAPPIIHRDIKPGNVIQRPDGSFCLVDFGSVREQLKPEGGSTVVGTFGFMAPEQFQGRALPASDVYAVAATALTLLTGTEPQNLPHKGLAIDVKAALQGHFDRRLVDALAHMLDPDPEKRATSVGSALSAAGLDRVQPERQHSSEGRKAKRAREKAERRTAHRHQHEKHANKRARREAKRAARHFERGSSERRPRVPPGVVLGIFLLLVFRLATLATLLLFAVALPLLFRILAMFDRRLLRVADRLVAVGERGAHGLAHAAEHIRHQFLGGPSPWTVTTTGEEIPSTSDAEAPSPSRRVRVVDVVDTDAEVFDQDDTKTRSER